MEANQFALGRINSKEIQEEKRKQLEFSLRQKKKPIKTRTFSKTTWRILPSCTEFSQDICFTLDLLSGKTYFEKKRSLQRKLEDLQKPYTNSFFPAPDSSKQEIFRIHYTKVGEAIEKNQNLRWIFKRFLNLYRIQHLRKINQTDPITLQPFLNPIYLNHFLSRVQYTFEADSFARHIHRSLLHHDGQIPCPTLPKNPYTNEHMTFFQLLSLIHQCRKQGYTFWSIEAFIENRYSLATFLKTHRKPLRLHAIQDTLKSTTDYEAIDTIYDFIRAQHSEHNATFPRQLYLWAIQEVPEENIIQSWIKYCKKWYEIDILEDDDSIKDQQFSTITVKTKELCEHSLELFETRKRKRRNQLDHENSSSSL